MDHTDFPCTCKELSKLLQVPVSPCCKHVVTLAHCCRPFRESFLEHLHSDVSVVPNFASLVREWKTKVNKLAKDLKIDLRHDEALQSLFLAHRPAILSGVGVRESTVYEWKMQLEDIAVVCPVDKEKSDLAFVCPWLWQVQLLKFALKGSPSFEIPANLQDIFTKFRDDMIYSHAVTRKSHNFGQVRFGQRILVL